MACIEHDTQAPALSPPEVAPRLEDWVSSVDVRLRKRTPPSPAYDRKAYPSGLLRKQLLHHEAPKA